MTRDEFVRQYPPASGEVVRECHCGSAECPGWKLVNPEADRRMMEAMEQLPQILLDSARRAGERMGREREEKFLKLFLGISEAFQERK